jgi:4-amino-4-deoxy-L-arabinose transferase-like glycosyltransferase
MNLGIKPAPLAQDPEMKVRHWAWQPRLLLLVMVLGLGLRLAYVRLIDTPPFSDMADYETMALNLLDGHGLIMSDLYRAYRPPGYPLLIAAIYWFGGASQYNVLLAQCLISVATVALAYLFTFHLFASGPRAASGNGDAPPEPSLEQRERKNDRARTIALVAAALFCFEESSIFFCGQMLTETLFTFLFVVWGWLLVRTVTRPSLGMATLIGMAGGLGVLVRPNIGPLVVLGAYWFFKKSRRYYAPPPDNWQQFSLVESPFAPPAIILLYAFLVVSLWTVRNQVVLGRFVPVSTNSGVNFYLGHHEDFGYASFGDKEGIRRRLREEGSHDEVVESKVFTRIALRFIERKPWEDMWNNLAKLDYLFLAPATWKSAVSPWLWWSYLDSPYRPWPWETQRRELRFWPILNEAGERVMPSYQKYFWEEGRLPLVSWGWPMIYLTLAGLAWSLFRRENIGFPLWVIVVYTLVLVVYFTNARFRAPLLPFLYPFAAFTLVSVFHREKRTTTLGDKDAIPSSETPS